MKRKPHVVVVNITSAPGVLGGAVLAAQWHSWYMAQKANIELWRMWDSTEVQKLDALTIRNFESAPPFGALGQIMPKLLQKTILKSDIVSALHAAKPDIVHIQNPGPATEYLRIARMCQLAGIKVVSSTHGFQECFNPQYGFDALHQRIGWDLLIKRPLHAAFRYVDAFLLGFPDQAELLKSLGVPEHKFHLVPNGIDPFFDHPASNEECESVIRKFQLDRNKPILLFMGNHTANKGLGTFMKLADELTQPATLVVGGGLRQGEPGKWTDGLALQPSVDVIFTDFLSVSEQRALYRLARVFVFPSISETLPLVVLEAMAAGLPAVAFATGGIPYQLAHGAGFVLPIGDNAGFKDAVLSILENDRLYANMSESARTRQRAHFSWDALADTTLDVYAQLHANC